MKNRVIRSISLLGIVAAASLLGACQTAPVRSGSSAGTFASVSAVKQANPDVLGGLFGREAMGTVVLAGVVGPNQTAAASLALQN